MHGEQIHREIHGKRARDRDPPFYYFCICKTHSQKSPAKIVENMGIMNEWKFVISLSLRDVWLCERDVLLLMACRWVGFFVFEVVGDCVAVFRFLFCFFCSSNTQNNNNNNNDDNDVEPAKKKSSIFRGFWPKCGSRQWWVRWTKQSSAVVVVVVARRRRRRRRFVHSFVRPAECSYPRSIASLFCLCAMCVCALCGAFIWRRWCWLVVVPACLPPLPINRTLKYETHTSSSYYVEVFLLFVRLFVISLIFLNDY